MRKVMIKWKASQYVEEEKKAKKLLKTLNHVLISLQSKHKKEISIDNELLGQHQRASILIPPQANRGVSNVELEYELQTTSGT